MYKLKFEKKARKNIEIYIYLMIPLQELNEQNMWLMFMMHILNIYRIYIGYVFNACFTCRIHA